MKINDKIDIKPDKYFYYINALNYQIHNSSNAILHIFTKFMSYYTEINSKCN